MFWNMGAASFHRVVLLLGTVLAALSALDASRAVASQFEIDTTILAFEDTNRGHSVWQNWGHFGAHGFHRSRVSVGLAARVFQEGGGGPGYFEFTAPIRVYLDPPAQSSSLFVSVCPRARSVDLESSSAVGGQRQAGVAGELGYRFRISEGGGLTCGAGAAKWFENGLLRSEAQFQLNLRLSMIWGSASPRRRVASYEGELSKEGLLLKEQAPSTAAARSFDSVLMKQVASKGDPTMTRHHRINQSLDWTLWTTRFADGNDNHNLTHPVIIN